MVNKFLLLTAFIAIWVLAEGGRSHLSPGADLNAESTIAMEHHAKTTTPKTGADGFMNESDEFRALMRSLPPEAESLVYTQGTLSIPLIFPGYSPEGKKPAAEDTSWEAMEQGLNRMTRKAVPLSQHMLADGFENIFLNIAPGQVENAVSCCRHIPGNEKVRTVYITSASHLYPRLAFDEEFADRQAASFRLPLSNYCRFFFFESAAGERFFDAFLEDCCPPSVKVYESGEIRIYEFPCVGKLLEGGNQPEYSYYLAKLSPTCFVYFTDICFLNEILRSYQENKNSSDGKKSPGGLLDAPEMKMIDRSAAAWGIRIFPPHDEQKNNPKIEDWEWNFAGVGFHYRAKNSEKQLKETFDFFFFSDSPDVKELANENLFPHSLLDPQFVPGAVKISLRTSEENETPVYRPKSNGLADNFSLLVMATQLLKFMGL